MNVCFDAFEWFELFSTNKLSFLGPSDLQDLSVGLAAFVVQRD